MQYLALRRYWVSLIGVVALAGLASCRTPEGTGESADAPSLETVPETAPGEWVSLFNGRDLTGWRGFRMQESPPGWQARDGALYFNADHGGEGYGDLTTLDQFSDFELELEWKISPGGNSGVLFRVSEDMEQEFHTGPEVQILDGTARKFEGLADTRQAGANYSLHPPALDVVKPVGEWNTLRLLVNGAHVEHWMNGQKIVEYELWTETWKALVAASKFKQWPRYGLNRKGHIVLQDHGEEVWYRNLRIRTL